MLSEDGGEGAETAGGLNVADDSNDHHGGGLEHGNGIDDLAFVHKGAGAVDTTDNVGHASLVGAEGSEVGLGRGIILGEGADLTGVLLGALLGEETKTAAAWRLKLTVGPKGTQKYVWGEKSGVSSSL